MSYPYEYTPVSNKSKLLEAFKGKKLSELPTPSFVVDRSIFKENCEKMLETAARLHVDFRAHVKTHKTMEGTALQLGSATNKTDKIVVSTLMEAWNLVPLMEQGLITDVLFSLPVIKSRLGELSAFSKHVKNLRLMLDNIDQVDELINYSKENGIVAKWSIFVKVNMGTNRAGFTEDHVPMVVKRLLTPEAQTFTTLYGFYCHAGHSYVSKSEPEAKSFLLKEIEAANEACQVAVGIDPSLKLQMSVGATPTAHAAEILDISGLGKLWGNLELHAGNYPFCDLQQLATHCIDESSISCSVIADVLSCYHHRGDIEPGEQLINAGVIAMARDSGPLPGYGNIFSPPEYKGWIIGRLSQEHGILVPSKPGLEMIPLGTKVGIYPQHSCITAASYPWYFVVDGGDTVKDIWVPFQGW